jgi:hypothetical protein
MSRLFALLSHDIEIPHATVTRTWGKIAIAVSKLNIYSLTDARSVDGNSYNAT